VSIGFGLWIGYPVAYPYYYDPYYYDPYYPPYYYPGPYGPYGYPAPPAYPPYPPAYPSPNYPPQYPPSNYPSQYPSAPSQYPSARSQYPSAQAGSIRVEPGRPAENAAHAAGLSFDVTPITAEVFIDGSYVGTVGQFTPSMQPLDVRPGHHRVEIRASGYRTLNFEVDVTAGQVMPLQGTMER